MPIDKDLLWKAQEKVFTDYKDALLPFVNVKKRTSIHDAISNVINNAYEIAHYNEIFDFFSNLDSDEDWIDEDDLELIVNYQGNVVRRIWNIWLDYNHPENYNFFAFESFLDIIKHAIHNL